LNPKKFKKGQSEKMTTKIYHFLVVLVVPSLLPFSMYLFVTLFNRTQLCHSISCLCSLSNGLFTTRCGPTIPYTVVLWYHTLWSSIPYTVVLIYHTLWSSIPYTVVLYTIHCGPIPYTVVLYTIHCGPIPYTWSCYSTDCSIVVL
jgi:hypothetical protein